MSNKLHVKKDDMVLIISGDDRGKKGKVLEVSPKEGKVIVEGRNMVKKHVKPRRMGDPGGIIESPALCTPPRLWSSALIAINRHASVTKNSPMEPSRAFANAAAKPCKEDR